MSQRKYSVYVSHVEYVQMKDFIEVSIWVKVKVSVHSGGFTFEAYGFDSSLMRAEDLAKKRALKLIGVRYYLK